MSETMTLVVVSHSASVLAACTVHGQNASALTVDGLVGDGLEIRDKQGGVLLQVQAEELELKTVDLVEDVLLEPQAYTVVEDAAELQLAAATSVTKNAMGVTVNYATLPAGEKAKVWVQLEGGPQQERFILTGEGADGGTSLTINHALPAGSFQALVAVSGHRTAVFAI